MINALESCLADLEDHIDETVEEKLFQQWLDFTQRKFEGEYFLPKRERNIPAKKEWHKILINDAIADFDQMALHQFALCSDILEKGTGGLLCVRANYGTGIIPSLFDTELFMMDRALDTLPTTKPFSNPKDRVKKLLDGGIPSINQALGAKTLEMGARFMEMKQQYPKINKHVHIYHPDLQGPMDICELLWGSSLFIDIYDVPDLVTQLLDLITDTYIQFMKAWDKIVPSLDGYAIHWTMLHRGHIMLRDDSAMNFSPTMFKQFIQPYDQRLLDEFGGGGIHFCGRGDHYIDQIAQVNNVYAVNMSQPECNDMEIIFQNTIDNGKKLIGLSQAVVEKALLSGRKLHGNVQCE